MRRLLLLEVATELQDPGGVLCLSVLSQSEQPQLWLCTKLKLTGGEEGGTGKLGWDLGQLSCNQSQPTSVTGSLLVWTVQVMSPQEGMKSLINTWSGRNSKVMTQLTENKSCHT